MYNWGDSAKITYVTRYGSYKYLVMLSMLANALSTFYNIMNDVLHKYLDGFLAFYVYI